MGYGWNMNRRGFLKGMVAAVIAASPLANIIGSLSVDSPVAKMLVSAGVPETAFMIPLLRRIIPSVIANELISVQPMGGPIGFTIIRDMDTRVDWGSYIT